MGVRWRWWCVVVVAVVAAVVQWQWRGPFTCTRRGICRSMFARPGADGGPDTVLRKPHAMRSRPPETPSPSSSRPPAVAKSSSSKKK